MGKFPSLDYHLPRLDDDITLFKLLKTTLNSFLNPFLAELDTLNKLIKQLIKFKDGGVNWRHFAKTRMFESEGIASEMPRKFKFNFRTSGSMKSKTPP